jgi:MOSC domain-containing protein YiiM
MTNGRLHQISVSPGGVPKLAVPHARIGVNGVEGDEQDDKKHHGGPDRAVCLFSLEVIRTLNTEGHPIAPGTTGENLTIEGLEWWSLGPGSRLAVGPADTGVELEITSFTRPCSAIRNSFSDLKSNRIFQDEHPGESRLYARVLREGVVREGDPVTVL